MLPNLFKRAWHAKTGLVSALQENGGKKSLDKHYGAFLNNLFKKNLTEFRHLLSSNFVAKKTSVLVLWLKIVFLTRNIVLKHYWLFGVFFLQCIFFSEGWVGVEEWALCQDQGEDSTTRQGRQPLHNHCCGSGSDQNRPDPDPTQKMS